MASSNYYLGLSESLSAFNLIGLSYEEQPNGFEIPDLYCTSLWSCNVLLSKNEFGPLIKKYYSHSDVDVAI